MDTYYIAGSAADPEFAHAELLSDKLVKAHPRIEVVRDMRHPCEWEAFRQLVVQSRGFSSPGLKAIIWRRDGRLVGSVHDFAKVLKKGYNLELTMDQQLIDDITAENLEVSDRKGRLVAEMDKVLARDYEAHLQLRILLLASLLLNVPSTRRPFLSWIERCLAAFVALCKGKAQATKARLESCVLRLVPFLVACGLQPVSCGLWLVVYGLFPSNPCLWFVCWNFLVVVLLTHDVVQASEMLAKADTWTPVLGHQEKKWEDGNKFDGTWSLHKPHRGIVTFPDGSTYEGALRNGLFQGIGTRTYTSGAKYTCMYQKGKRQGKGKFDDGKGNVYEGMYRNDMCHGKGTRTWPDGRSFAGEWKENHATGKGSEKRPRADNAAEVDEYMGDFVDGIREGKGKMVYHEGHAYDGEWCKGARQGKGTFTWKESKEDLQEARFEGRFEKGVPAYGQVAFGATGISVAYPGEIQVVPAGAWMETLAASARKWWESESERKPKEAFKAEVPEKFPFADESKKHLMVSQCLTEEVWKNMSGRLTKGGMRITQCTAPGLVVRKHAQVVQDGMPDIGTAGLLAADADSYLVFRELFDAAIARIHGGYDAVSSTHKTEMDHSKLQMANIDTIVSSCKITVRRSLANFPAAVMCMSLDDKAEVESAVIRAVQKLKKTEAWTAGEYFPMQGSDTFAEKSGGSSPEEIKSLQNEGFMFDQSHAFDGKDFAQGRGVYRSSDKSLIVHINKDEHAEFILHASTIKDAFGNMVKLFKGIDAQFKADKNGPVQWARSDSLGYITSCPHQLGTGMVMQITVKVPKISKRSDLAALATKVNFRLPSEHVKGDAVHLICPSPLGKSELEIANGAVEATNWLTKHERVLQGGRKTLWLWDQHPKVVVTGPPGSMKRPVAKCLAQEFGLEYVSVGELLAAEAASQSEAGAVAKEHMAKGHYVPSDLVTRLVVERLSALSHKGWVVEGFPRTKYQAAALAAAGLAPNKAFVLEVDPNVSMERCSGRATDPETGNMYHPKLNPAPVDAENLVDISARLVQRDDDASQRAIELRLGQHKAYAPELPAELGEVCRVYKDGPPTELNEQAIAFVKDLPPLPPAPPVAAP